MMDTVPPVVHWEPYAEYFEKWGDKLCYIHFVDSNGYDQSHLPLGSGILNMEEILRTILRFGYDGWLCVELLSAGMHEPEMYAAREQRMLRELLDKLGV